MKSVRPWIIFNVWLLVMCAIGIAFIVNARKVLHDLQEINRLMSQMPAQLQKAVDEVPAKVQQKLDENRRTFDSQHPAP